MMSKELFYSDELQQNSNISTINCHQFKQQNSFHNLIVISLFKSQQKDNGDIQKIMFEAEKLSRNRYLIIQAKKDCINNLFYILLLDHHYNLHNISKGMQIYVHGNFNDDNTIIFSQKTKNDSYFVLEPKTLISATKLSSFTFCRRKQIVKEFFKNQSFGTNLNKLRGKILHYFFQHIIQSISDYHDYFDYLDELNINESDLNQIPKQFMSLFQHIHSKFLKEIYNLRNKSNECIEKSIFQGFINVLIWIKKFVINRQTIIQQSENYQKYEIQFIKWIVNEKKLSSQIFGLVGIIDVIMEIKVTINNSEQKTFNMPIEIKTGQKFRSQKIQLQTYLVLMSTLYQQETLFGMILFLNSLDYQIINNTKVSKKDLLFFRNIYISELYQIKEAENDYHNLPKLNSEIPSIEELNKCCKCEVKYVCYGLNALQNQQKLQFPIFKYQQIEQQINEQTRNYLNNILQNLRLEKKAVVISQVDYEIKQKQQISSAYETHYILSSRNTFFQNQAIQILQQFIPDSRVLTLFSNRTQKNYNFNLKKDPIIIQKYLLNQTYEDESFQEEDLQYVIRMQVQCDIELSTFQGNLEIEDILTQKIEIYNQFKHYNFITFEIATNKQWQRKKEILILGYTPQFKNQIQLYEGIQGSISFFLESFNLQLNEYQMKAIQLCLLSEDFALISGNYGKRKMLSHLLFLLGYTNKKVIFYAVDNEVLEEQIQDFKNTFPNESEWILKLSNEKDKNQDNQQQNSFDFKNFKDLKAIDKILQNKHFYFSTCSNCTDILQSEPFDYCIVDQSTKIIEPQCISCILKSKVFILLQDSQHHQPLVKSQKAKSLKTSLFQRLSQQFKNFGCLIDLDQEEYQFL